MINDKFKSNADKMRNQPRIKRCYKRNVISSNTNENTHTKSLILL